MELDFNNISTLILPASAAVLSLTLGSSVISWAVTYYSTFKDSRKVNEKMKKGDVITLDDIPGPVGYPFVGIIPLIFPYARRKRVDQFFHGLLDAYKGLFKIPLGPSQIAVFCEDPAIAKKIAISDVFVRNDTVQKISSDIAPYALFMIPSGETWKKHRKGLQPAFGPVHIRDAFKISVEVADELLDIWDAELKKGNHTRNVMEDFTMVTGDVISRVAFSMELGAVKSLETHQPNGFHHHTELITSAIESRMGFQSMPFMWRFLGSSVSQLAPSMNFIKNILKKAIDARIARKQNSAESNDQWSRDLMDRLLEPQGSFTFSEEEVMNELFGFFLAGHETTANTLTWGVLEMAYHPEIVEKLREEVDRVIGDGYPTFEQLSSLKYVDAFVKETLRIHPVLPINGRTASQDLDLTTSDGNTLRVKKGAMVLVSLVRVHRSKECWGENADEFYPDRWLIKKGDTVEEFVPSPGSYLPFWDGPHNCIGQKIALVEAKMMIARLVQRFNVKLSPKQGPLEPVVTLTYGLKNGLLIDISRRI
ncbi:hypothetical protein HK098_007606 [Nowakowskiella sp. JEL0407]|nr:hypothetical protein HK098_007606 [Nowakowskiella sp. JEL0407]